MDPTNRVVQVADEAPLPSDETGRLLDLVHRDDFKVIHATPPTEPSGRNDVQGPCEAGDELSNMGSHEDENDEDENHQRRIMVSNKELQASTNI